MKNNCKLLCMAAAFALLAGNSLMAAEEQFFGAGKGTAESPYWVENADHLQNVRLFPNAHFIQTCDIDTGDAAFLPIGDFETPFKGVYNGEGHKITVKDLGATQGDIRLSGIWGFTSGASISNLNIDVNAELNLDGRVCSGALVACADKTKILNCVISSDSKIDVISEKCLYAGGIIGYSAFDSSVRNCSFEGRINGRSNGDIDAVCAIGGIVGENRTGSSIAKCTLAEAAAVSGNSIEAPAWVGGIVGFNEESTFVCDCHAVVPQIMKPEYNDVKRVLTEVRTCNSVGDVSGYSTERIAVGGIVGFNAGSINSCISQAHSNTRGSILKCSDAPSALIGGVAGDNAGNIRNSASLSSLQMLSDGFLGVGGIAGRNSGALTSCKYYFTNGKELTSFTAMKSLAPSVAIRSVSARGGIVGVNDSTVNNAIVEGCKVIGSSNEQAIASYGYLRSSYGTVSGLELKK